MITPRALKQVFVGMGRVQGVGAERGPQNTHKKTGKSSSDPVPFTHDFADLLSEFWRGT